MISSERKDPNKEPINFTTIWQKNKAFFIIVVVLSGFFLWMQPTFKEWDDAKIQKRQDRRANFENFATRTLGEIKVVDGYWDHNGGYGGRVSTDLSKPMMVVKCRIADDVCWVVRQVN